MNAYLHSFSRHIPRKRVSNDELAQTLDTSDEWIFSHTGIRYRHLAEPRERASSLGIQAAEKSIARSGIPKEDIDFLIFTSSTPDYPGSMPPTASVVQHGLGLPNAGAMDLGVACSGFVYAVEIAKNLVQAKTARHVLIVSAEVYSTILDWNDRSSCVLFGDGGAACMVSVAKESGIGRGIFRSDGIGSQFLYTQPEHDGKLIMNGRQVYNFVIHSISMLIYTLLELNEVNLSDIAWIIPHQANQRMIEAVCKREKFDNGLFFSNIKEYGNTASASIPIALSELEETNQLSEGDPLILLGFGGGFSYGGMLVYWRSA